MWKIIIGKEIFSVYIWFLRESEIDRWTIVSFFFEVNIALQNGLLLSSFWLSIYFFFSLLTLCLFDEDDDKGVEERGNVLHQLRRVFLSCSLLLNFINGLESLAALWESVSWHPLRWKFKIKSHTDGGDGFDGGGRM